ncbi:MAG: hypothetical protein CMP67_07755 [Flavobacteriales bacterium]|nr:hypothetical protein [Flavobacteriales bacterium]MBO72943.1 hypothetical protein [Flavobacteriales bacterium]|tara:strand:+ start:3065 stop:3607 length:543 start_codon:yes stop_codon:yes gene_type:complete
MRSIDSQFAYDTHQMMDLKSVRLSFSGEFTSDLVSVLLLLAKNNVGGRSVMKKVYNVMIESLENLIKHAFFHNEDSFPAIFILGKDEAFYYLATGNKIENKKISELQKRLEKVNHMNRIDLVKWYNSILMSDQSLNSTNGAGLGIIDMAIKSNNKFEYGFHKIDENHSFFTLKIKIESEI